MKHIPKNRAVEYKNADSCIAYEYETDTPDINIARVEVSGRYPETGTAVNTKVTELVYVASGAGTVSVDGIEVLITQGDVVSVVPGEQVFWAGNLSLIIACSPAWHAGQYRTDV